MHWSIIAKQCLTADTLIYVLDKSSSRFIKKPLSELAHTGSFNVLAVDPLRLAQDEWKAEPKKAIITNAGIKAVIKLITEDGRKVCGNKEHRLYVRRNGKTMKIKMINIDIGDELVCQPE